MVMASPSMGADLPQLTPEFETSVPNLFIVGELGGLALIKNAINQGRDCADTIAARIPGLRKGKSSSDVLDALIVGAGPAGISASLRAIERKLNYLTVDEGEIGGTVSKYPRQKLVLTSPVELPHLRKIQEDGTIQGRPPRDLERNLEESRIQIPQRRESGGHQKGRGRRFHRHDHQRATSGARGGPRAGQGRNPAKARRQGRGTAEGDVSPDRGGPLREQEDSCCGRRR